MPDSPLLSRIESVKVRIRRQEETRRLESDADKIGDRATTLRSALNAASTAVETSSLLRAQGVEVAWDAASIRSLRSRVSRFAERSRSTPSVILEPNVQLWPSLDAFPEDAQRRLIVAWQTWVDAAFPVRDEATLATFERIAELEAGVRRIRKDLARRSQFRATIPNGPEDFEAVREAAAETDQAWSELVGGGLPEGVPEFLDAASTGQATLEQFTDAVRDWFESKGLTHLIHLSIGHRGSQSR